jgi:hypothetical protein
MQHIWQQRLERKWPQPLVVVEPPGLQVWGIFGARSGAENGWLELLPLSGQSPRLHALLEGTSIELGENWRKNAGG